jgi:hypothetical protein
MIYGERVKLEAHAGKDMAPASAPPPEPPIKRAAPLPFKRPAR